MRGRAGEAGPAGLAVRQAVRRGLADLATAPGRPPASTDRPLVLVACSGGPDSLALAAATAFVAPRLGLRAGAVLVDHGVQATSAQVADRAGQTCRTLGLDPVEVVRVVVSDSSGEGPEAAARQARYAALDAAAERHLAAVVLLGHTRDDQAESVLLGLLRGSGARSLSGLAPVRGRYRRPLMGLPRRTTEAACAELGLQPWADPHNDDPAYARSRVRALLAELEQRVGPGTSAGLARTAELLRADAAALDEWADRAYAAALDPTTPDPTTPDPTTPDPTTPDPTTPDPTPHDPSSPPAQVRLDCAALAALPTAIRTRVVRRAALAVGARSADLTSAQLTAVAALVTDWHGQGAVAVPGAAPVVRDCGRLVFASQPSTSTEE